MEHANKKTLESYESGFEQYIENTPQYRGPVIEDWLEKSTAGLSADAKILEIGSAHGQDAKIVESGGYYVEKTDATAGFVAILQKSDPEARVLDVLTDDLPDGYDLILSNAVLLHFNDSETRLAAAKIFDALKPGGVFSFTLKQGEGESWQNNKGMAPRYFNFWSESDITTLLSEIGYINLNSWTDTAKGSDATWIMVLAQKPQDFIV